MSLEQTLTGVTSKRRVMHGLQDGGCAEGDCFARQRGIGLHQMATESGMRER